MYPPVFLRVGICLIDVRGVMSEVGFVGQELRRHFPILRTSHLTLHTSQNSNLSFSGIKNTPYLYIFIRNSFTQKTHKYSVYIYFFIIY